LLVATVDALGRTEFALREVVRAAELVQNESPRTTACGSEKVKVEGFIITGGQEQT